MIALRLIALEPAERRHAAEAVLLLAGAGIALRLLPFQRLARRLGRHMAESARVEPEETMAAARLVRWAVEAAARRLPWKPVCLPQAVAAQWMLRRRGISSTLYLGLDPGQGHEAHAWVRVGPMVVTGPRAVGRFVVVASFA